MVNTKFKKFLAGMLTMTLVLGSSLTAFAADPTSGSTTGTGTFEGHVSQNVVKVSLPTQTDGLYNYTIDPEGLIAATEGAKYDGVTYEDGYSVYFKSASENTYSGTSASANVINMGTVDVDLTVSAKTEVNDNVIMVEAEDDFDASTAQLYLELQVNDGAADQKTKAIKTDNTSDAGTIKIGLCGNADNYEIQYTENTSVSTNNGYYYGTKDGVQNKNWNSCYVSMSGACNTAGDWSATGLEAADVTVTWAFEAQDGTEDFTDLIKNAEEYVADQAPEFKTGSVAGTIEYTVGAGDSALASITKIEMVNNGTTYDGYHALAFDGTNLWDDATDENGVITFDSDFLAFFTGTSVSATITGVAEDGDAITATVTVKLQ